MRIIYSNATERYESKSDSLAVHECVIDKNGYVAEKAADELEYFPDESDDFEHYEDKDKNRYYPVTLIGWNEKGQVLLRSSYDALDYVTMNCLKKKAEYPKKRAVL